MLSRSTVLCTSTLDLQVHRERYLLLYGYSTYPEFVNSARDGPLPKGQNYRCGTSSLAPFEIEITAMKSTISHCLKGRW